VSEALRDVDRAMGDYEFKQMFTEDGDRIIRRHKIEAINKFLTALLCIVFFFIGAPLGAIIRKGGLGLPVIISVLVFILYYILDNMGYRMARVGAWAIWFGKSLAMAVLVPMAIFFTYKANRDSMVFNMDAYRNFFSKLLGLRLKRHVYSKEVIIEDPHYAEDARQLERISSEVADYARQHHLKRMPNVVKVFFKYEPDHLIEHISEEMEKVIDDLSNTKDKVVLAELNNYPIVSVKAHTRPFEHQWMNVAAFFLVPIGLFCYLRMWHFRLRLNHDLNTIKRTNAAIVGRIKKMGWDAKEAV